MLQRNTLFHLLRELDKGKLFYKNTLFCILLKKRTTTKHNYFCNESAQEILTVSYSQLLQLPWSDRAILVKC